MEKSLKTIQVLAKTGRILSKIVWICCIVGAAGCAIGIVSLLAGVDGVIKIGGVAIHGIIEGEAGMSHGSMYAAMAVGLILCTGEFVLAKFAEHYFGNELEAGTPFTLAGADELKRLGVLIICIRIGAMVAAEIAYQVMNHVFQNVMDMHIDDYASVGLGIAFLIFSVIFRYGSEINAETGGTMIKGK